MDSLTLVIAGLALMMGGNNYNQTITRFSKTWELVFALALHIIGFALFLLGIVVSLSK